MIWFCAAILRAAVDFSHAADTDGFAHIDVAGDGRGADVEPVLFRVSYRSMGEGWVSCAIPIGRVRWEFLSVACLDGVGPTCRLCQHMLSTSSPPSHTGFRHSHFSICILPMLPPLLSGV